MKERDLRKLSRAELLELLVTQGQELERVKQQLDEQIRINQNREIMLSQAGNIAEAALALNGVFEAAQKAADQYLENIQMMAGAPYGSVGYPDYGEYAGRYDEQPYPGKDSRSEAARSSRDGSRYESSRYEGGQYDSGRYDRSRSDRNRSYREEPAQNDDYMNYGDSDLEIYDVQ